MSVWYGDEIPNNKGLTRKGGLPVKTCTKFFEQCEFDMNKWIISNGLRCSGKIGGVGDDKFVYDPAVTYEEDCHEPAPEEDENEFTNV